ncbi:MAG: hypothetical protein WC794_02870 [Candidatus Doudnabacteria bacterium]|jgi:hypothetical protein
MRYKFVSLVRGESEMFGWPTSQVGQVDYWGNGRDVPVLEVCFPNGKQKKYIKKDRDPGLMGVNIFAGEEMLPGDWVQHNGMKFYALVRTPSGSRLGNTALGDLEKGFAEGVFRSAHAKLVGEDEPTPDQCPGVGRIKNPFGGKPERPHELRPATVGSMTVSRWKYLLTVINILRERPKKPEVWDLWDIERETNFGSRNLYKFPATGVEVVIYSCEDDKD